MRTLPESKGHPQERRATEIAAATAPLADLTEAALMVASLLADPFDRSARMEARTWLTAWMASRADRPSYATVTVAAKGGR
jgi:hypothetical protein